MIELRRSSKLVDPGARTPPTEPLNRVSPVNTSDPFTTKLSIPSVCPGVWRLSMTRFPASIASPGSIVRSTSSSRSASSGWARISTPCRSFQTWFSATWS